VDIANDDSATLWYPESVRLLAPVAIISNQCKAVVSGNAIGNLAGYHSSLRANFDMFSTVIIIQLNTITHRHTHTHSGYIAKKK